MRYILVVVFVCLGLAGSAQYKSDNVLFKTVYIEDLCAQLKNTPNAVLLDVRSKGEYEDTSTAYSLNIGRLKKTIHLDIREMPARWRELTQYKDQPLYVMCSHSQRSRRVSKMLADSGFTNVININGGLTTYNLLPASQLCKDQLHETQNNFKTVSPLELCGFLSANKDVFILDVRKDSAYGAFSTDERVNIIGKMNGSVNIPYASLEASLAKVPANKKILVVDDFGNDATLAARLLVNKGYKDVQLLFNGLDMVMSRSRAEVSCANRMIVRPVGYQMLAADEFDALIRKQQDVTIVDVRPADEFNNKSPQAFRNTGHIRNAINIPYSELDKRVAELGSDKNKPVIIYHFNAAPDAFKGARLLANQGFTQVQVLTSGIFNLRWQAANYKGRERLKEHVVDIPAENM
jgi:rhodanese-related sulfurtransferase